MQQVMDSGVQTRETGGDCMNEGINENVSLVPILQLPQRIHSLEQQMYVLDGFVAALMICCSVLVGLALGRQHV